MGNLVILKSKDCIIDEYGLLCAQIADLEKKREVMKARLIAGEGLVDVDKGTMAGEGQLYRVTVSTVRREYLDMDAVRSKLSRQFIAANSKVVDSLTVRCVARSGMKEAA